MAKISVTLATALYGRTEALRDGSVSVHGVDLICLALPVEEIFWRMLRHQEFHASEMSLSSYLVAVDQGDRDLVAIPVFLYRTFRHGSIFVNTDARIQEPRDLIGKRVGVPEYEITAAVWIRGILEHEYGVRPNAICWYSGGEEQPGRTDKSRLKLSPEISVTPIAAGATLNQWLASGKLDALITARVPSAFVANDPRVKRLFPDYRSVELAYYRKTGIFPIMHVVTLRRDVHEKYPWLAKNLEKAFGAAKAKWEEALFHGAIEHMAMPWMMAELEQELEVFGRDQFWPYGLENFNRKTLETFVLYAYEQGLIQKLWALPELFAKATLDEFRI